MNRFLTLALTLICISQNLFSQSVGLVLSGGGAKGLYHIGIIKALEENNIPIDYVAGTSMGSIVAAMYAVGMSPDEMYDIFSSPDIEMWLSGKTEDKYTYYYRRAPENGSMVSFNIDFRKFLERRNKSKDTTNKNNNNNNSGKNEAHKFPSAISSSQLDVAMLDFFGSATAAAGHDFDSLFVPFRCVSVNILDKKEYLWEKGDLGMAVRSSMSIPLVFNPITIDGMVMVDGGVLNNFPWQDVKKDFNPDVLIGGICTGNVVDPTTITGQIELLAMGKTNYDIPDSLGLSVSRMVDVGILDYSKYDYIINLGYEDALKMMPQIKQRIERRENSNILAARRLKFKEKCPTLVIDSLKVLGLDTEKKEFIEKQLSYKEGDAISFDDFKAEYFKITEGGIVSSGFPISHYNSETGKFTVAAKMTANSTLKALAGVNISSANINAGYLGLEYSRIKKISSYHSLTGYLGNYYSSASYDTRFNYFDRKTPFYLGTTASYQFYDYGRANNQRYSFGHRSYDYSRLNSFYIGGLFGVEVSRTTKFEFRGTVGADIYKNDFTDNDDILIIEPNKNRYRYASVNLSLSRNSLNFRAYPTRGLKQNITLLSTATDENFDLARNAEDNIRHTIKQKDFWLGASFVRDDYYQVSNHFTLGYSLEGIYTNIESSSDEPLSYNRALITPGFYPTEHSKTLFIPQYHSSSFVAAGIKPIIEWNDNLYLKTEGFAYYSNFEKANDSELLFIISSSIVYQSPIGPVSFNYSYYENDTLPEHFFTLNIGFILFKERGIKFF